MAHIFRANTVDYVNHKWTIFPSVHMAALVYIIYPVKLTAKSTCVRVLRYDISTCDITKRPNYTHVHVALAALRTED